nr:hypothetical protein [Tanacetum cinerariifolium]
MTTPTVTSTTDSQMHNSIMAAGLKDRLPMLATGRYPQWQSYFLRYIDTRPNGDALRKCILSGPYKPTTVVVQAVATTDDSPAIPEHATVETPMNMSPANKAYFESEKEVIHLILTGIGNEIYSTVDACQTAQKIILGIRQCSISSTTSARMVKVCDDCQATTQLDEVSYHKLFDILKQYQKEANELRAERLARNPNLLALVATAQANQDPYYQTSKSYKSYAPSSKPSIPTRTHTTTRYKGKEIAKPITPPSELDSEEDNDPEQAQRDKYMRKNLALSAKYAKKIYKPTNNNLRTSSNSRNKNVDTNLWYKNDNQSVRFRNQWTMNVSGARENVGSPVVQQSGIQCFNCKEFGHFPKEYKKPKKVKDSAYQKEKMLLCKQAEKGVPLQAEQYDWVADTDEEIDEQELEAHYSYMEKIQEVPTTDTCTDSEPLEKEMKECKTTLAKTSKTLEESISVWDSYLVALQNKQTEFEKYKAFNDRTIFYDKLKLVKEKRDELIKQSLLTKSHYEGLVKQKTKVAFCLGLRFAVEALRFIFKDLAFCLGKRYVLSISKILCFVLEALRFVYLKDLAFCFGSTAFCLKRSCILPQKHNVLSTSKILHFVSETLHFFYFKDLAFCLGSTAFCLL